MSTEKPAIGSIGWHDLTVENADQVRDFYQEVVGLGSQPLSMGDYSDYVMTDATGTGTAGVCHARGGNTGIPAQWLVYFIVADIDESIRRLEKLGGSVVVPVRDQGGNRYCVIRDPAGAVCALYQTAA